VFPRTPLLTDVALADRSAVANRRGRPGRGAPLREPCLLRATEANTAHLLARENALSGLRVSVFPRGRPPARPAAASQTPEAAGYRHVFFRFHRRVPRTLRSFIPR